MRGVLIALPKAQHDKGLLKEQEGFINIAYQPARSSAGRSRRHRKIITIMVLVPSPQSGQESQYAYDELS